MILSFGLILILGFIIGYLLNKIKIPGLVGMILIGLLIGPYVLNLIDPKILNISSELRQIALVIILTRSGLNLDLNNLKKIGRPAILMSFLPATFEIIGVTIASYFILHLKITEGILLGAVLGAVSPAVLSPRMISLIDNDQNPNHVAEIVLAGSSVDDIYTIIIFYGFLGLVQNNSFDYISLLNIPISIILGILLGIIVAIPLALFVKKTNLKITQYILIILSISFLMIGLENILKPYVEISALLGIIVIGITILFVVPIKAKNISNGYNNLWLFFEILLFVLVGASLNISYVVNNALLAITVILLGLTFRTMGVLLALIKTGLTTKQKIFIVISYLPKATVQASIGGIALSMGLDCGEIVLTVSVLAILITAPIGAFLIDNTKNYFLNEKRSESTL